MYKTKLLMLKIIILTGILTLFNVAYAVTCDQVESGSLSITGIINVSSTVGGVTYTCSPSLSNAESINWSKDDAWELQVVGLHSCSLIIPNTEDIRLHPNVSCQNNSDGTATMVLQQYSSNDVTTATISDASFAGDNSLYHIYVNGKVEGGLGTVYFNGTINDCANGITAQGTCNAESIPTPTNNIIGCPNSNSFILQNVSSSYYMSGDGHDLEFFNGNGGVEGLTCENMTTGDQIAMSKLISIGNNLWGVALSTPNNTNGVLYSIPNGTDPKIIQYSFTGGAGGSQPNFIIQDNSIIYGTFLNGGANNLGGIFKFDTTTNQFSIIYNFTNGQNQSYTPIAIRGSYLYGVQSTGGTYNAGYIYKMNLDGSNFNIIYNFTNDWLGGHPIGLTLGNDGAFGLPSDLYGITTVGGGPAIAPKCIEPSLFDILVHHAAVCINNSNTPPADNYGIIFKIDQDDSFSKVSDLSNTPNYITQPNNDGIIYVSGNGFINIVNPAESSSTSVSSGINGQLSQLVLSSDNKYMYGVTTTGGINNVGQLIQLDRTSQQVNDIADFTMGNSAVNPTSITLFNNGDLYGTAQYGGGVFRYDGNSIRSVESLGNMTFTGSVVRINNNGFYFSHWPSDYSVLYMGQGTDVQASRWVFYPESNNKCTNNTCYLIQTTDNLGSLNGFIGADNTLGSIIRIGVDNGTNDFLWNVVPN